MKTKWIVFWITWCGFWFVFDVSLAFSAAHRWSGVINGTIQFVCAIIWCRMLKENLAA